MQGVHYGVFGLGNKQYEHFNAVGKRMHKNMEALGATPVCARGDGDDDDNIGVWRVCVWRGHTGPVGCWGGALGCRVEGSLQQGWSAAGMGTTQQQVQQAPCTSTTSS